MAVKFILLILERELMTVKPIEVGQFCRVLDSTYVEHGVKKNDVIYVAGDSIVAVDEKDPYMLRRLFIGAWMKGDHIDVNRGGFTIDGKRLKACTKAKQERLNKVKDEDFGEEPKQDGATD